MLSGGQFQKEILDKRISVFFVIIIAVFVLFFVGFWYLQIVRGPYYDVLARENILKEYPLPAPRGLILSRTNKVLAENRLSHNLFITPRMSKNLQNTLQFLSGVLVMTPDDLKRIIEKEGSLRSLRPVLVYQDLSLPQLAYIAARKIEYPELDIKQETKRSYNYDELFSHAIGYVGEINDDQIKIKEFPGAEKRDYVGQSGLERYYNSLLMGKNGFERKVVDSHGAELKEFSSNHPDRQNAIPGKILKLSLDYEMQKAARDAFVNDNKNGAAVAMNIKTGEVLVLYNSPGFNPNDFIPRIAPAEWKELLSDPDHPLQNRSIQNRFAPGSTFKVVMALAALQEKKITPDTTFFCGGSQQIYNRTFRCWKPGGHGYQNLHDAIVHSCDVYFYNVGLRLDIDVIAKYAKLLGLGSPTLVDLPNENRGLVPSREWKMKASKEKWFPGETISVAIGQGPILVTALQMASLYSEIASDGIRKQPHLLTDVLDANGTVLQTPEYKTDTVQGIDREYFEFVKKALLGVVNEGTGTKAKIPGFEVCGKTGTVQVVGYERGGNLAKEKKEEFGDHAWFIAFAPYEDPEIAMAIFVQHGGHGADAAAPLAKTIYEAYLSEHTPQGPPAEDEIKQAQSLTTPQKSAKKVVMATQGSQGDAAQ
jgi:penicillin-binding protein 2